MPWLSNVCKYLLKPNSIQEECIPTTPQNQPHNHPRAMSVQHSRMFLAGRLLLDVYLRRMICMWWLQVHVVSIITVWYQLSSSLVLSTSQWWNWIRGVRYFEKLYSTAITLEIITWKCMFYFYFANGWYSVGNLRELVLVRPLARWI